MDNRNQGTLERLKSYIAQYDAAHNGKGGQAHIAAELHVSPSLVSQYIKGTYPTPASIESAIDEYLDNIAKAAELCKVQDYVPTSISEEIYASIRNAHLTSTIVIEYGDAGVGKTKAALKYMHDYPASTIMVTCNPCNCSNVGFLRSLCRVLNLPVRHRSDMFDDCAEHLRGKKILIIDEAQHLSIKAIETIRSLWDMPTTELGIVLIGNHAIVGNTRGRNAESFAQLNNRVKRRPVRTTTDVQRHDIELLFPVLEDDAAIDLLYEISRTVEGIRGTVDVFLLAANNRNISYDGILAAAKHMRVEVRYNH